MEDTCCTRCGHPQHEHRQQGRCEARIVGDGGLTIGRCGCAGYTTAALSVVPTPEPMDLRLRLNPH
jgi:L-cystine uptake protein TcyP (sodium:dicarboxylate symporter family)